MISESALAAMSVDLGSQFLKIGLVKPGVPMEIVLNKESHRKTPNIVAIRHGERFFSDSAAQLGIKHPVNAYSYFVDLLGKKFDNPVVDRYRKIFPHITLKPDDVRGTVLFETDNGTYSVETILAMVLWNAKETTETFAGQPVKDVVITIPAFFNQAERKAVTTAVEIAGLNLLQLLSDGLAAGLNYGVFRRKEITEQAQTLLVYDIGATKTRATILEYRLAKEKDSKEQNPVMVPLGIGYDRTLGGLDITLALRDHLLTEFRKQHKTQKDITENPRAMAKLFKEAERVKQVLSANIDHFAQIESLFEDKDFKVKVTRQQLEDLAKELEPRFLQPLIDALKMAELSIDQVNQIVLMGAGTRVPKLQQLIQEFAKGKELSKFLNTDEAIAIGAVYQAAALSKGFKVKKFAVQELQLYPIQVDFISFATESDNEAKPKTEKLIHRTIYSYKSLYPTTKKIISFTSHTDDFKFNVNYGSLSHLSEKQLSEFGSLNISEVNVVGVSEAYKTNIKDENTVFKGVKAHFHTDSYGIVRVERAELIVEEKEQPSNSTFSNIMGKIGSFFSKSKDEEKDQVSDDTTKEESKEELSKEEKPAGEPVETPTPETPETQTNTTTADNTTETTNQANQTDSKPLNETVDATKNETKKEEPKLKVNKIALNLSEDLLDSTLTSIDTKSAASQLKTFEKNEKAKAERDAALNSLESAVYDIASKLEEETFIKYGTEEELTAIRETKDKLSTWLEDDVTPDTPTSDIKDRKKELDATIKKLKSRRRQHEERPKHVEYMIKLLNDSEGTFALFKNLTELFSETELSTLEKVLTETKDWFENKTTAQEKLQLNEDPAFTVGELQDKSKTLEREVKYLFNKFYSAKLKAEQEAKKKAREAEKNKTKEAKVEVPETGKESVDETEKETTEEATEETKEEPTEETKEDKEGEEEKQEENIDESAKSDDKKDDEEAKKEHDHDRSDL
uniref:Hypoxia up-regulated protein 1 n=1 Tax=Acrobeloides nanus TaxID=290746 RepID=A0A914CYA3_9BILA